MKTRIKFTVEAEASTDSEDIIEIVKGYGDKYIMIASTCDQVSELFAVNDLMTKKAGTEVTLLSPHDEIVRITGISIENVDDDGEPL